MKIAVITSRFNEPVTESLFKGAMERLEEVGIARDDIATAWVPGAVELPLIAQQFAMRLEYDAIICLGAVIRGETGHYDYVCEQVSQGCQRVSLQFNVPVIFGVLTTDNAEQAFARVGGAKGHKGREAVDAAIDMMKLMQKLKAEIAFEDD